MDKAFYFIDPFTGKQIQTREELWAYVERHSTGNVRHSSEVLKEILEKKAKIEEERKRNRSTTS